MIATLVGPQYQRPRRLRHVVFLRRRVLQRGARPKERSECRLKWIVRRTTSEGDPRETEDLSKGKRRRVLPDEIDGLRDPGDRWMIMTREID
jgi:hypothetical protein